MDISHNVDMGLSFSPAMLDDLLYLLSILPVMSKHTTTHQFAITVNSVGRTTIIISLVFTSRIALTDPNCHHITSSHDQRYPTISYRPLTHKSSTSGQGHEQRERE
jgi:hypothetical protein